MEQPEEKKMGSGRSLTPLGFSCKRMGAKLPFAGTKENGMKWNTKTLLTMGVALVTMFGLSTMALAEVKIGVVDLQLAIASTKAGKAAKTKLEKFTKSKQEELDKKVEKIKKMEAEMQKQLPLMSEDGKKDMLERYRKEMQELQESYMGNQEELAKRKQKLLQPILEKMGTIVQDIALSKGYTVILDKGDGSVLYFDPATDLTSEVIKQYNSK